MNLFAALSSAIESSEEKIRFHEMIAYAQKLSASKLSALKHTLSIDPSGKKDAPVEVAGFIQVPSSLKLDGLNLITLLSEDLKFVDEIEGIKRSEFERLPLGSASYQYNTDGSLIFTHANYDTSD